MVSKRNKVGSMYFEVEKLENEEQPTFELSLFVTLDEKEVMDRHCKICKETHKLFYVNENYNCDACKIKVYRQRLEERIAVKAGYEKSILKGLIDNG